MIGRKKEQDRLNVAYQSPQSEFIIVYGRHRADREVPRGVQIDLLIDRKDDIVNLCEMKFCHGKFLITKKYDKELAMKQQVFRSVTGTRKSVHLTLVTAEGVERNSYSDNISSEVTLDDLFKE